MFSSLKAKVQAKGLLRRARSFGAMHLIVVPTSRCALMLVSALRGTGARLRIVGRAETMRQLLPDLGIAVMTPLELWQNLRETDSAVDLIVSFPDQTIGQGPSFRDLNIDGDTLSFSTIEVMLLMRYRAVVYVAAAPGTLKERLLQVVVNLKRIVMQPAETLRPEELDEYMARMMRPLIRSTKTLGDDWYGAELFASKTRRVRRMLALNRIAEADTILRLCPHELLGSTPKNQLSAQLASVRRRLLDEHTQ